MNYSSQLAVLERWINVSEVRITAIELWMNTTIQKAEAAAAAPLQSDGGDTALMFTSTALVLLMTLPGLALFYAGLASSLSVISTCMESFAIACMVSVLWVVFGYSLSFSTGQGENGFIGDGNKFFLHGVMPDFFSSSVYPLVGTIPEALYCLYHCMFAIIAAAIMTGASNGRMTFHALMIFIFCWHILVYCPVCHWVWGGGSLHKHFGAQGVMDFAGGTVVHISSGFSAIVVSLVLGARHDFSSSEAEKHYNQITTFTGGCLLWVGWFGFNAGSALSSGGLASMSLLMTHISASSAALSWMAAEYVIEGHPTMLGILSGAIGGLVAITPAAGFVDFTGAVIIGLVGGVFCYFGVHAKKIVGADDTLDAFGIHGVGGMIGTIGVGLFANPTTGGLCGSFYNCGHPGQVGWQILGAVIVGLYCMAMTAFIMWGMKFFD